MKTEFIDPAPTGRAELEIRDETGDAVTDPDGRALTRWFLPSSASDNPHLDASYYARFGMMSPDARAAYRDGDWSRFEGMRFSEFTVATHVRNPSALPLDLEDLATGIGADWGSAAPFAAVWGALVDGGERLVVYREAHEKGLSSSEQGQLVVARQQPVEVGQPCWIDPSTWARNPEQPTATGSPDRPPPGSIAAAWQAEGVAVRKAHNDRVTGWAAIEELLGDIPDGRPGLVVYDTCPNLIRSLSGAPRDPKHPEDVDPHYRDDHALDAFRYLVMGLLGGPRRRPMTSHSSGRRAAVARVPTGIR